MKINTPVVLICLSALVVFSSCSRRYAYLRKVKIETALASNAEPNKKPAQVINELSQRENADPLLNEMSLPALASNALPEKLGARHGLQGQAHQPLNNPAVKKQIRKEIKSLR